MKKLPELLAMIIAWLLIAGFAWVYTTNQYMLEKLDAGRAQHREHLQQVHNELNALEQELVALEADPFYIELLARNRLRWNRPGEIDTAHLPDRAPSSARARGAEGLSPERHAVFYYPPTHPPRNPDGTPVTRLADSEGPTAAPGRVN